MLCKSLSQDILNRLQQLLHQQLPQKMESKWSCSLSSIIILQPDFLYRNLKLFLTVDTCIMLQNGLTHSKTYKMLPTIPKDLRKYVLSKTQNLVTVWQLLQLKRLINSMYNVSHVGETYSFLWKCLHILFCDLSQSGYCKHHSKTVLSKCSYCLY